MTCDSHAKISRLNPTYLEGEGGQNDPQRNKCLRNSENRKKKIKKKLQTTMLSGIHQIISFKKGNKLGFKNSFEDFSEMVCESYRSEVCRISSVSPFVERIDHS